MISYLFHLIAMRIHKIERNSNVVCSLVVDFDHNADYGQNLIIGFMAECCVPLEVVSSKVSMIT